MLTALALASLLGTTTLYATDDVWVYPNTFDQTGDPLLRVWGDGTSSVGDVDTAGHSYSMMRFDLSSIKDPVSKLKSATLVLFHEQDPNFTADDAKNNPLEARLVDPNFDEKKWSFEQFSQHMPEAGDAAMLGKTIVVPAADGKPFKIEINLLSGKADLRKALDGKKAVAIAITSKMQPNGADGPFYHVFSRSVEKERQPRLVLEFSD